jgi:hypothetical protein
MSYRGLRDAVKSIVPKWLSDRPGLNAGFSVLYTVALMGDAMIETVLEGVRASWPGKGTPDADPFIGQGRGLLQGPSEPSATYEARLRAWLTTWQNAGSDEVLLQVLQAYLIGQGSLGAGVQPIVRIVTRAGNWTVASSSGAITQSTGTFNWDQALGWDDGTVHQPAIVVTGYWSDAWLVIAPATGSTPIYPPYTSTSDPAWLSNFGPGAQLGGGFQIPLSVADGVRSIVNSFKAGHEWIRAIIWASDSTSFAPGNPIVDGTFGDWSKLSASGTQVQARVSGNARYLIAAEGF